ncbi:hypothetical protein JTB14_019824 [Gonioctena quinquepunctata]|nr:hypothetical protein JTB14_019824 [Gonioctena quinquepunctata]
MVTYAENIKRIIKSIDEFDKEIRSSGGKMRIYFWLCFLLANLSFLYFVIWKHVHISFSTYERYYYEEDLLDYRMDVSIFLYFWLATEILHRFIALNKSLGNIIRNLHKTIMPSKAFILEICSVQSSSIRLLRNMSKLHNILTNTVQDINDFSGYFVLFYVLYTMAIILEGLTLTLWITVSDKGGTYKGAIDSELYLITMYLIIIIMVSNTIFIDCP